MTFGTLFDAFSIKKTKTKIINRYKSSRWEYILVLNFSSNIKMQVSSWSTELKKRKNHTFIGVDMSIVELKYS